MKKIEIYDTTLRDGAQSEGINFSVSDKFKIINKLDDLGIDYIEAGWPGANPVDNEVFKKLETINLKNAKIAAFGSTRKANTNVENDNVILNLVKSGAPVITIFGKSWDFQVTEALNTTLEENLSMIKDSIEFLIKSNKEVFFDAEHFFDGFKNNKGYALEVLKTAHHAGAKRLILCDTNGGCINNDIYKITREVVSVLPDAIIGIHAHNDAELAVANTLASIDAGAMQVQGTINGYGERCGNANLCSIIPNLQVKREYQTIGNNISKLVECAKQIAEIANKSISSNQPYVGSSAFAHKAGIHASGVRKNSQTYEHFNPEIIGNIRRFLVSDQAGSASIKEKAKNFRFIKLEDIKDIKKVADRIKQLEWQGFAYEGADAGFEILAMDTLGKKPELFELMGFRVIGDTTLRDSNGEYKDLTITEASVKIKINNEVIHTVSEGDGPVNALDIALRKALSEKYPFVNNFKLSNFKVRILDSKDGTAATVRVSIESTDGINKWDTVGVSANIIAASYNAIADSILYGLILQMGGLKQN